MPVGSSVNQSVFIFLAPLALPFVELALLLNLGSLTHWTVRLLAMVDGEDAALAGPGRTRLSADGESPSSR